MSSTSKELDKGYFINKTEGNISESVSYELVRSNHLSIKPCLYFFINNYDMIRIYIRCMSLFFITLMVTEMEDEVPDLLIQFLGITTLCIHFLNTSCRIYSNSNRISR